ncbi:hypothetical protein TD95_000802 [Thielaviopsis punctulata]|uniref:ferric-chelate reductase (NADPH) n=1 Tax=Thielaviopsis punctulata TaxID=72032 RepID=A0A0F4ZM48_9PEZI|nr:hypothetical protein TD95_000802 [Thielaviopsis punctulata]
MSSPPSLTSLAKRIYIPLTPTSPPGLIEAHVVDPWSKSGKYARAWSYFALALTACVLLIRLWHFWQDRIRRALYKQEIEKYRAGMHSFEAEYAQAAMLGAAHAGMTSMHLPQQPQQPPPDNVPAALLFKPKDHMSNVGWANDVLALFRWVFYRPIPDIVWRRHRISFSSLAVLFCVFLAALFVLLNVFLQQPLYWQSIQYGSPPVAIRAGMLAIAITPWIVATSMKANILSVLIGIGPERLNVFHRWLGYITLLLALIHTIPFYVQPVWDNGGMKVFSKLFKSGSGIIYGTGISCLVPLIWLCVASLPFIRRMAYEVFTALHAPVAVAYVGLLFWHTKNYLGSWDYLYTTVAIWGLCNLIRLFNLNWIKPWWRMSFLVGDEAAVTLMPENAVKITIPTRMRWKPGQFVYLRMPGISILDNHPFTISSLCSGDFPSAYGEDYRDCVLVFKPYGGFTRRVLESAVKKGPFHTYRAYLDGPYGGLRRDLSSFETVILIAGGSGITALMSQLLNLIKRMREDKAITRKVVIVWAMKRLEALDWFREELRICRESAPPESVMCKFFVTATKRDQPSDSNSTEPAVTVAGQPAGTRALTHQLHDKLDGFVAGVASKRNSALIAAEADGNEVREKELRAENEDKITALPHQQFLQAHSHMHHHAPTVPTPYAPAMSPVESNDEDTTLPLDAESPVSEKDGSSPHIMRQGSFHFPPLNNPAPHFNNIPQTTRHASVEDAEAGRASDIRAPELAHLRTTNLPPANAWPTSSFGPPSGFEFGFPETPTEFQRSLMRFAFPVPHHMDDGWSIEYGRPDLAYMLREWSTGGPEGRGIFGRRTAVFVCGPPALREGVAATVAKLQANIWGDELLDEIFLHTENYAL